MEFTEIIKLLSLPERKLNKILKEMDRIDEISNKIKQSLSFVKHKTFIKNNKRMDYIYIICDGIEYLLIFDNQKLIKNSVFEILVSYFSYKFEEFDEKIIVNAIDEFLRENVKRVNFEFY